MKSNKETHPNFIDSKGQFHLVKCPECKQENYAISVHSGICAWCGYDANRQNDDKNPELLNNQE
jgi:ribosomal protein S27E